MSINVTQSSMPKYEDYIKEIKNLWRSKWLTNMGEKHNLLQEKLKEYLKVNEISLFSNGHLALEYALESLQKKGEVITTPFTFISTTNAIVRKGFKPVFCDISEEDFNIDVDQIASLINENTVAIIPVHVYGNPCNVTKIQKIANEYNLKVIYDAAHAFGVEVNGRGIGTFGDISMFSFHATKVFHTIEGGALTYSDCEKKSKFETLKNFGIVNEEDAHYIGGNGKLDEFRAAMGLCNLAIVDFEIKKRKKVFERYEMHLKNIDGIKIVKAETNVKRNYAYMPVVFDGFKYTRNEIFEKLRNEDIHARKYFYPLITNFTCYNKHYDSNKTPIAEMIAGKILTLPMYSDLSLEDVDRICSIILN